MLTVVQMTQLNLPQEWINLINYTQQHPYSELTIKFQEGKPTLATTVKENLKF